MNHRHGSTLMEMLVVITVGSTLSGIAIFLLFALMKSHDSGREHLEYCRTINRLSEQFRSDVHSMQQTSRDNKEAVFELSPGTGKDTIIRYQCHNDRIDRIELQGEKIMRQESYMLPPGTESSLKTQSRLDAPIVCITIVPREQPQKFYRMPTTIIEAVLDRDARLVKVQTTPKKVEKAPTEKEPAKEALTDKTSTVKTPTEEPLTEKTPTEKASTEKTSTEKSPTEEPPTEKPATEQPATEDKP
jgi:hypothetical protein